MNPEDMIDAEILHDPWTAAAAFGALLLVSALLSGTDTALFSLQERERRRIEEGETATDRQLAFLLARKPALITTLLMGDETASILFSTASAAFLHQLLPDAPWLSVLVVTPTLVLLADITPKVLAWRFNRRWAQLAVWPVTALYVLFYPIRLLLVALVDAAARLFGVSPTAEVKGMHEDEFLVLVDRGLQQGTLEQDEQAIIQAVFELDDVPVSRLMTPRPDIFSVPADSPWDELLEACREARYSRVPVWEEEPDNVIGVLLIKDLLRHRRHKPDEAQLRRLLVPPVWVPSTKPASEMMREMITHRTHIAFVADEHGSLIGLVSLDDLIVELVGELGEQDDEGTAEVGHHEDGALTAPGHTDIEDFCEDTGIEVPRGEYHTLGGFVFHELGRIPKVGDVVEADGVRFEVLEMEVRRITMVRVERVAHAAEATP